MIIVDELVEERLEKALATTKNDEGLVRCVYLKFAGLPNGLKEQRDTILQVISRSVSAVDKKVFVCGDGDLFLLGTAIPSKEITQLTQLLSPLLPKSPPEPLITSHELNVSIAPIQRAIDQKTEARRKAIEEVQKQQQLNQAQKKRESLLHVSPSPALTHEINSNRTERTDMCVMIIEDDAFSRKLVENILKKSYRLIQLDSAEHALQSYIEHAPDVLFLDINLPDVSGQDLLKSILVIDPKAYIVMFSGNNDQENVTKAIRNGARGFVAKPFSREKLVEYIHRCPTFKQPTA